MNRQHCFCLSRFFPSVLVLSFIFAGPTGYSQLSKVSLVALMNQAVVLSEAGKQAEAEVLYMFVDSAGRSSGDTTPFIGANFGLVNNHIDEPDYIDSLLDMVYPYFSPSMPYRYRIEYHLDRAHVADLRNAYDIQVLHADSALQISREANDTMNIAYTYFELSVAYQNVENFESALEMATNSAHYFNTLGIVFSEGFAVRSIAVGLNGLKRWEASNRELERSNALFKKSGFTHQFAFNYGVMGNNFMEMKQYKQAEEKLVLARKMMEENEDIGFEGGYPQVMAWLGQVYLETGRTKLAKEAAERAYFVSDSMNLEGDKVSALEGLIRVRLSETKEGEAYLEEYLAALQSQYETEKSKAVLGFENKYKAEERERKILELDKAGKEAEIRAQNNRLLVFIILAGFALLILLALILFLRARYRTRMQINELNRKALQLQINPHFFFNVLNSINQYIAENDQKSARYYLVKFAKLMRLSLENSQFDLVPLGQEADLVEAYLHLEKLRKDNFDFEVRVPEDMRDLRIPPLMIQPFVENAVVHAFPSQMAQRGQILLEARTGDGDLTLIVTDNGVGIQPKDAAAPDTIEIEGKTSLAIGILEKRLNAYGKRKGGIRYATAQPERENFPGTQVFIKIPLSSLA